MSAWVFKRPEARFTGSLSRCVIFCTDAGATLKANDAALVTFCNWRKRSAANEAKQAPPGEGQVVD